MPSLQGNNVFSLRAERQSDRVHLLRKGIFLRRRKKLKKPTRKVDKDWETLKKAFRETGKKKGRKGDKYQSATETKERLP